MSTTTSPDSGDPRLLRRVSRSMMWNALLLPLIAASNFALAILIRRYFVYDSGYYDALIGILNTVLFYSGIGLPHCLNRFLAELEEADGQRRIRAFLAWSGLYRFLALAVALVPLAVGADRVAAFLPLGPGGGALLRVLVVLICARAALEFVHRSLQGLLEHVRANLAQLLQALLAPALLLAVIAGGGDLRLSGVFPLLGAAAAIAALAGATWLHRAIRRLPEAAPPGDAPTPRTKDAGGRLPGFGASLNARRVWGYALFMYGFEISNYFVMPAFTSPGLFKVLGDPAPVALFNVGFQLPLMVTVLVVSSFQGVYRPLFARLLVEGDRGRLQGAFFEVSKVQAFLLIPAAVGLATVVDDLVPLAFGAEFAPAVTIAAVLSLLLPLETLFNLGSILLSTAQRYRPVAVAQGVRVLAGPLFLLVAATVDLVTAAVVFGLGRVVATSLGYLYARRAYDVRFPWRFVLRLGAPVTLMAVVVLGLGVLWPPSWPHLLVRVVVGVLLFAAGVRAFRILGPREADLLQRAQLPGTSRIIAWLIPPR